MFDTIGNPDERLGGRPLPTNHIPVREQSLSRLGQFEYCASQTERLSFTSSPFSSVSEFLGGASRRLCSARCLLWWVFSEVLLDALCEGLYPVRVHLSVLV
jgi:hypothetical protein